MLQLLKSDVMIADSDLAVVVFQAFTWMFLFVLLSPLVSKLKQLDDLFFTTRCDCSDSGVTIAVCIPAGSRYINHDNEFNVVNM